eukprot:TRINITY_DN18771_c0_g1_i1.p1 TRINITY_DN18771_c0_g1~~TRINITY_DN18771_c0_g1_i1.p1  ORF type:complete len:364 (-),score=78.66 TRINITY_DN18771_c0_g1_i1:60-1151(-)
MRCRVLPRLRSAAGLSAAAAIFAAAPTHRRRQQKDHQRCWLDARVLTAQCETAFATSLAGGRASAAGGAAEFSAAYELQEELGRGSFGIVQRARHLASGQFRAVKRLPLKAAALQDGELEALANLDHPNVAGLFEYFRTGEEVLLVQELCGGTPLAAFLEKGRRGVGLGAGEMTAQVVRQMLEAVRHCHERGFVHRDLKADNFIFECAEPSSCSLKLIDFGLAGRVGHGEKLDGRAGSVHYSAPEALAASSGYGLAADMWSIGALFFLLLTGEHLIKVDQPCTNVSEELQEAIEAQAKELVLDTKYTRLRVRAACSRLPPMAADLLRELLRPDPASRITAEEALRHPFIVANTTESKQHERRL